MELESRFAFLHLRLDFRFDSRQCWIPLHLINEQLHEQDVTCTENYVPRANEINEQG